jgi:hypothetical protein
MANFDKQTTAKYENLARKLIIVATACSFTAATLALGMTWGAVSAPEPCFPNLHSTTYPMFIRQEQGWLEDKTPYPTDSEFAQAGILTPRDLAYDLVDRLSDSEHPSQIYRNPANGKEFWIPGLCYFELDAFGDPIIYRKPKE